MQGWVKLHRKIQESKIWDNNEPFDRRSAWIDLLLLANHEDKNIIFNGKVITVKRGERITSVLALSERWNWSRHKVSDFLNLLESEQMIVQKRDNKKTLISIVNYDIYQVADEEEGQQKDNKRTTKGQQKDTNKNDKNEKNDKNIKSSEETPIRKIIPPEIEWVKQYCEERKNGIDAQRFCNYYEARDWRLKNGPMRDWQAAVRYWETNKVTDPPKKPGYQKTQYDFDALNKMINGD